MSPNEDILIKVDQQLAVIYGETLVPPCSNVFVTVKTTSTVSSTGYPI
uniref:Uncharacterized protein n=1 Tax=Rhizophora mucronata TaxID=61149 RepID=A0A2P2IIA6_RHIMU